VASLGGAGGFSLILGQLGEGDRGEGLAAVLDSIADYRMEGERPVPPRGEILIEVGAAAWAMSTPSWRWDDAR
jgi:hypothetical protein